MHRVWSLGRKTNRLFGVFQGKAATVGSIAIFLPFVVYGWLLFRAQSWQQIVDFSTALVTLQGGGFGGELPRLSAIAGLPLLLLHDAMEYFYRNEETFLHRRTMPLRGMIYAGFLFCILLGLANDGAQFIYFAF